MPSQLLYNTLDARATSVGWDARFSPIGSTLDGASLIVPTPRGAVAFLIQRVPYLTDNAGELERMIGDLAANGVPIVLGLDENATTHAPAAIAVQHAGAWYVPTPSLGCVPNAVQAVLDALQPAPNAPRRAPHHSPNIAPLRVLGVPVQAAYDLLHYCGNSPALALVAITDPDHRLPHPIGEYRQRARRALGLDDTLMMGVQLIG